MTATPTKPDRLVLLGMLVAAVSAAVASFTGLRGLALASGWPVQLAWLLPLTIDAYAMTAARVWLARTSPARTFARANAIGAITGSIAGNATYHLVQAGLLTVSWPIVVIVGAVPAAVLGLTAHLHALTSAVPQSDPGRPEGRPQPRAEDDLLNAARHADAEYRASHGGRPITRDALRAALHIGGTKATELRRQLVAEHRSTDRKEAETN
jgi:hypothetical protein